MTIVVATEDFEVYHGVVNELRDRNVRFTTIEPAAALPKLASVVITAESDDIAEDIPVIVCDPDAPRAAVDEALARERDGGRRIVGVDPGKKPGIAVLEGDDIVAAFQLPLADAAEVIRNELAGAPDPVVRLGDGARHESAQLIDALQGVPLELVDETASTPHLGDGTRGMGDVLAAVNIARRSGEPVSERDIEPTTGEIQVIKSASRERSADNRAITADLARRVAVGELSMDEALAAHRKD